MHFAQRQCLIRKVLQRLYLTQQTMGVFPGLQCMYRSIEYLKGFMVYGHYMYVNGVQSDKLIEVM